MATGMPNAFLGEGEKPEVHCWDCVDFRILKACCQERNGCNDEQVNGDRRDRRNRSGFALGTGSNEMDDFLRRKNVRGFPTFRRFAEGLI
jgi:hypothetical protein